MFRPSVRDESALRLGSPMLLIGVDANPASDAVRSRARRVDGRDGARARVAKRAFLRAILRSRPDRISDYHGANGPVQRHADVATPAAMAHPARPRRLRGRRRPTNPRDSATGGASGMSYGIRNGLSNPVSEVTQ